MLGYLAMVGLASGYIELGVIEKLAEMDSISVFKGKVYIFCVKVTAIKDWDAHDLIYIWYCLRG